MQYCFASGCCYVHAGRIPRLAGTSVSRLGTVRYSHGASGRLADWLAGLLGPDRARGTLGDKPTEAAKAAQGANQE